MMVVFEFDEETGKAVEQPQEKKEIQPEVVKSESSRLEKAVNDFEMKSVKRGQLVNATVVKVTSDGLLVDVGQKSEGFIPRAEASTRDDVELASTFKTGDMIQCRVVKIGDDDGMIILSKKRADFELVWDRLKEAKDNKEILTTVATKAVKG
ncbi:MAG TPA: S1 RNA-binding domain-containing protein, partial [Caldisericia bacterium]|nr:S1 RNA-binding domain-containing protein [Caldisericia bacterium]